MAVSLRDIAEKAGLSKSTVAHILSNRPNMRIASDTRARVLKLAEEMGYRPNIAAKTVSTGRFNSACIVAGVRGSTHLPLGFVLGIELELAKHQMHMMISCLTPEATHAKDMLPHIFQEWATDGLIIHDIREAGSQIRELILQHQIPAIWYNSKFDTDSVYPNDYQSAIDVTHYLYKQGHRKIAFLYGGQGNHFSIQDRICGYRSACTELEIHQDERRLYLFSPSNAGHQDYLGILTEMLQAPDKPTAFLCYNLLDGAPLMTAAKLLGMDVPGDISIIMWDDRDHNEAGLRIDTVILPFWEMSYAAVDMLRSKIDNPRADLPSRCFDSKLNLGYTSGPPKI